MNSKLLELKWITKLIISLVVVALLQISDGRENGFANPNCSYPCSDNEYQCNSCSCIRATYFCDKVNDCGDFSDEPQNCTSSGCSGEEYQCNNRQCVSGGALCDQTDDCTDNSDEDFCEAAARPPCDSYQWQCPGTDTCIPVEKVCDGVSTDCPGGGDEGDIRCVKAIVCKLLVCHQGCFHPPFSTARCYCKKGYKMDQQGLRCVDVNECSLYGYCDQRCANTIGSFTCSCANQYKLDLNNKTCRALGDKPLQLLVGSGHNITRLNSDGTGVEHIVEGKIGDLDYDVSRNRLFWIDMGEKKVLTSKLNGEHKFAFLNIHTLPQPCSLSYDWIGENLYIADCLLKKIKLYNLNNGRQKNIISDGIQSVKCVAVDPITGYLFYSDKGRKPSKLARIVRAFMDGSSAVDLKLGNMVAPSSITLDSVTRRIYWTDYKLDLIQTADYNGLHRQTIISGGIMIPAAVSLTHFEDKLYWADITKMAVVSVSKFEQTEPSVVWQMDVKPVTLRALHQVLQPSHGRVGGNPCKTAACSQLCVLTHTLDNNGRGYRCLCEAGFQIQQDGRNCIAVKDFLLFATEHAIRGIPFTGPSVDAMVPKIGVTNSRQPNNFVALDFINRTVIFSDIYNRALFFQHMDDFSHTLVMRSTGIQSVEGISVDWVTNLLYFTDFYYKTLSVTRILDSSQIRVLLKDLGSPRSVVVHPGRGYVYYADWLKSGNRIPFIGRCHGDGSHNISVHKYELGWPNGMCIDFEDDRLYWVDAYFDRLQHSDLDGNDLRTLQGLKLVHPFGVAVFHGYIYYTDWKLQTINRVDKAGNNLTTLLTGVEFLRGLRIFSPELHKIPVGHPCAVDNGGCSHFCYSVPKENATSIDRTCGCPFGLKLSGDKQCIDDPTEVNEVDCNSPETFKCALGRCIPSQLRCDKENDCLDNTDELGCDKDPPCPTNKFQCDNGKCLSFNWRCDGDNDCGDMSDEKNCPRKKCASHEFRCNNTLCIHKRLVCDTENNCGDGSDEGPFCATHTCHIGYFQCLDKRCIPERQRCDGDYDCLGGEDETDCPPLKCSTKEFKCASQRQCVPRQYRCDGAPDCLDQSDEKDCPKRPEGGCHPDEFKCVLGGCIPQKWRCDLQADCLDQSDEANCEGKITASKCTDDHAVYRCANDKCIPRDHVCDGRNDCGDGSDEDSRAKCPPPAFTCPPGQWECPSKERQCIDIKSVCDGIEDCPEGTDESQACNNDECMVDNGGCSFSCLQTPQGAVCVCPAGQQLNGTKICDDIDECLVPSSCSQKCVNVKGSYKCLCEEGYQILPDNKHCAALRNETTPKLIVSNMEHFIVAGTDLWNLQELVHVPGAISLAGVDIHVEAQRLYFSDSKLKKLRSMNLDGSNLIEVISTSMNVVEDIAVDWIGGNLYWNDFSFETIEVARLDGSYRRILISENVTKPRGIELDPRSRLLFWSDWGQNPQIERAGMCGCDRTTIISTKLYWPNGLSIDYPNKRLYFADARLDFIEFCDYDGRNRHQVIASDHFLRHPHDLVVFEDFVLWTDRAANKVSRCNKYSCRDKEVIGSKMEKPLGIVVNHPVRQPDASNPCKDQPCSHLCLLSPRGYRCECPEGMTLKSRHVCMQASKSYLIYGYKDGVAAIDLPVRYSNPPATPLSSTKMIVDIEFDSKNKTVFLIQGGPNINDTVRKLKMFTSKEEPYLPTVFAGYPASFAFDWISGYLFWADPDLGTLNVMRLDDDRHYRKVLLSNTGRTVDCVTPIAIVVDPKRGILYWADQGGHGVRPKIASVSTDGSRRLILNQRRVDHPEYLARDDVTGDLFWSEGRKQQIFRWDASTRRIFAVVRHHRHPAGLAVQEGVLYFADTMLETLNMLNIREPGSKMVVLKHNLQGILPLAVYYGRKLEGIQDKCSVNNGGCEQLCLHYNRGPDDVSCECGTGFEQLENGTCSAFDSFLVVSQLQMIRGFSHPWHDHAEALVPIAAPGKMASQIDVHVAKRHIYWCDHGNKDSVGGGLHRVGTDGAGYQRIISSGIGVKGIRGLAVDWIAGNLYFSNALRTETVIEVCRLNGTFRLVIVKDYNSSPRALAVNPIKRLLYWIDGGQFPKIERANLDGTGRVAMVTSGIVRPRDITVDIATHDVYWVDSAADAIQKISFLGGTREYVVSNLPTPYGLTVFGNIIYWVDRNLKKIFKSPKSGQVMPAPKWLKAGLHSLADIVMFDRKKQPNVTNPCSENYGGCEQLCFALQGRKEPQCACAVGHLAADGKSCQAPSEFLILAAETEILSISLDRSVKSSPLPALQNLSGAVGIAVDFDDNEIYFSQVGVKQLSKYIPGNSSVYQNITQINSTSDNTAKPGTIPQLSTLATVAEGLAYDWINKRLYWSDASSSSIVGMYANGTDKRNLAVVASPRAVAVNPCKGYLFWTSWVMLPKIERSSLTGSKRTVIVDSDLGWPNGLGIDYIENMLYWVDALKDRIERSDFNGDKREIVVQSTVHPFSVTVFGNFVYWTDWMLHGVYRAEKNTGADMKVMFEGISQRPMEITVFTNRTQMCTPSLCDINNGGCSDTCTVTGSGGVQCGCNDTSLVVGNKEKMCVPVNHTCPAEEFVCQDGECLKYRWVCDGDEDCDGGDDENENFCADYSCDASYFRCKNGRCIPPEYHCDHDNDCKDNSDELQCAYPKCGEDQFTCGNFRCIDESMKCNGVDNCRDGVRSDEQNCPPKNCSEGQAKCPNNNICLDRRYLCDGDNDCGDNEDENPLFCKNFTCRKEDFLCKKSHRCIPQSWVCNGEDDCGTGEDEHEGCEKHVCVPGQFECDNGRCISKMWVCDGIADCSDATDEKKSLNCSSRLCPKDKFACRSKNYTSEPECISKDKVCNGVKDCYHGDDEKQDCPTNQTCSPGEFLCNNKNCIPSTLVCDHIDDCDDNSDEPSTCDYPTCSPEQFTCTNKRCVSLDWVCDGEDNCGDDSDENQSRCSNKTIQCSDDSFACANGKCINSTGVCDKKNDCSDWSDEKACGVDECSSVEQNQCAHECVDRPSGYECRCRPGYRLMGDKKSCRDINECVETPAVCSQVCVNREGNYTCKCNEGYLKTASERCKRIDNITPWLIFTNRYYIREISVDGENYQKVDDDYANIVALDYLYSQDQLYFVDVKSKVMYRMFMNTTGKEELIKHDLPMVEGMTLDWIGRKVYWLDAKLLSIMVCELNGTNRLSIIKGGFIKRPRAIVVNPFEGYVYWTDWGVSSYIGRIGMDGSNGTRLITEKLGWPNALTIDFETNRLFWADAHLDWIQFANTDGTNRHTMRRSVPHPFAMTMFEDWVYWTDWNHLTIEKANKYSGKQHQVLLNSTHRPMDIHVYHPMRQKKGENPCGDNNGGCSHLCLIAPGGKNFTCACPDSFILDSNNRTCTANCSLSEIRCGTVDDRCISRQLFCDGSWDCKDGTDEPADCPGSQCSPGQYRCRNHNCTYSFHVCDLDDNCGDNSDELFCSEHKCEKWEFRCNNHKCIPDGWKCDKGDDCGDNSDEAPNLCGKRKCDANKFLCDNGRCIPNDWKCDFDDDCGDGSDEKEEWGCRNKTCKQGWWKCRSNYRCIPDYLRCNGKDDCRDDSDEKEENCPTCHPTGDFQCANKRCIPKRWLCDFENDCGDASDEDPSMCAPLYRNCSETEWRCKNQKCIRAKWICDHENDCLDNSDEDQSVCKDKAKECGEDEFRCGNSHCFSDQYKCNGKRDCYDLADELDCKEKWACPKEKFQCSNKVCIELDWLCDGQDDCGDQSDESSAVCGDVDCDDDKHFKCANGKCIPKWRLCDKLDNCGDGSDETNTTCAPAPLKNCTEDQYRCENGRCISPDLICNNIDDCGDASEEKFCFKKSGFTNCTLQNGGCEQICTDLSEGSFYCSCRVGFKMSSTSPKACDDVNECSKWGNFCPQLCNNVKGSFKCQCADGFKDDKGQGTECKSEDVDKVLFFSTIHEIRRFVPRKKEYMGVISQGSHITALDVNIRHKVIYWTDDTEKDLYRSSIPETKDRYGIPDRLGIKAASPCAIAVDWVEGNVYWTDIGTKSISVTMNDGRYQKELIEEDLEEPLAIAVNPKLGLMYWTDADVNSPKIEMAWMNGEHRQILVSTRLRRPAALTVDCLMYDRVYWVDSKENIIESMKWDGTDRVTVLMKGVFIPVSIDVFENKLFWVSQVNGTGFYMDKFGRGNASVIQTGLLLPTAVRMFHYRRVDLNVKYRCPRKGATCSHLCLLVPGGFQCACPNNSSFIEGSKVTCDAATVEAKPIVLPCDCWNGGSCLHRKNGSTVCLCPQGYSGVLCEHLEPVKLENNERMSHLVIIVVPTVIVSLLTIGVLVVVIIILKRRKTPKEKSSAAVISYNPSGKVEIATEGQGQTETLAPANISDISGATQFSNPIYETLQGADPNRLNLNLIEETSFYENGSQTSEIDGDDDEKFSR